MNVMVLVSWISESTRPPARVDRPKFLICVSSYLLIELKTEKKLEGTKTNQKKGKKMESNKPTETEIDAFKNEVIARINQHPAMGPDSTCVVGPDFDSWDWEALWQRGTVDSVVESAESHFERWGY